MLNWRTHPDEDDLIRYCDGELRAKETDRMARHLEACWDCRTRLDDLKQTIAEYVRYHRQALQPSLPLPPQPWKNLNAEFIRLPLRRTLPRNMVWLIASVATAATGILFYRANEPKPAASPAPVVRNLPQPAVSATPRIPPPVRTARDVSPGPEDELRVIAALDRIGAGLGDPIDVVRTPHGIVVTCMGLDSERVHEVRAAIGGMWGVAVEVSPRPAATGSGSPLDVVGAPRTADDAQVADELLRSSDAMMARAHALRRLAIRFPVGVEATMSASGKALLADLRQRHESGLARQVSTIARALGTLPETPAVHTGPDWQAHTLTVFSEAEEVDRLLGAIYAGSRAENTGDRPALMAVLAKLQADVR